MLKSLYISNYALIDKIEVDFKEGLTIITGETGAGKSIILGALSLILGERADMNTIRDKSKKTIVEGIFGIGKLNLDAEMESLGIEFDGDELIVRREIAPNGRSRAFVNDTPVQVSELKNVMTQLIDIHSQHSNMLLSTEEFQIAALDSIGKSQQLLSQYQMHYFEYKELCSKLEKLVRDGEEAKKNEDYLRFQFNQLQELNLQPDEDERLEEELALLSNVTDIKAALWEVNNLLDNDSHSLLADINAASRKLTMLEGSLKEVEGMSERMNSAVIDLKDIVVTLNSIGENLVDDPARLEKVNNRLDAIYALERKHSLSKVNDLIELRERIETSLKGIETFDFDIEQLKETIKGAEKELAADAEKLTNNRKQAAEGFIVELKKLAQKLGLRNLEFDITFDPTPFQRSGVDKVEFMFSFNKNQELMPVKNTASGGEVSRLMLCVKSIIARHMNLPTIIFDEVDTGVSGEIATQIGQMMHEMSSNIQVIAITHLPQVASCGNHHMRVYKTDTSTDTLTMLQPLDYEAHVNEIARMLSGENVNKAAIENAHSLIADNKCVYD